MEGSSFPHLPNAPIEEAIIDIQFTGAQFRGADESFEALMLERGYAASKPIYLHEIQVEANESSVKAGAVPRQLQGARYEAADRGFVVQLKGSSFTVSKLKPYINWDELKDEAAVLWKRFYQQQPVRLLTRLGVRYVNIIEFDVTKPLNFDDYLSAGPKTPEGCQDRIAGWMYRVMFPVNGDAHALLTTASKNVVKRDEGVFLPVILDIDVFKEGELDPRVFPIWESFDELRHSKNVVFFGSLTPKALEMFR